MKRGNLCLSRRPGQSVEIGDVTVTVLQSTGGRVRLSIKADEGTRIVRSELVESNSEGSTAEQLRAARRRGSTERQPQV